MYLFIVALLGDKLGDFVSIRFNNVNRLVNLVITRAHFESCDNTAFFLFSNSCCSLYTLYDRTANLLQNGLLSQVLLFIICTIKIMLMK